MILSEWIYWYKHDNHNGIYTIKEHYNQTTQLIYTEVPTKDEILKHYHVWVDNIRIAILTDYELALKIYNNEVKSRFNKW